MEEYGIDLNEFKENDYFVELDVILKRENEGIQESTQMSDLLNKFNF